jgi:hypothetical protein
MIPSVSSIQQNSLANTTTLLRNVYLQLVRNCCIYSLQKLETCFNIRLAITQERSSYLSNKIFTKLNSIIDTQEKDMKILT